VKTNIDEFNKSRPQRCYAYLAISIALTSLYALTRGNGWQSGGEFHTLLELGATLLALIVGIMALLRYYSRNDSVFLVVGAGFLGTAFLDGYHALVTSSWLSAYLPTGLDSLIPWSWIASRLFLSVVLLISYAVWRRESLFGKAPLRPGTLYWGTGLFTGACFILFTVVPLPQAYFNSLAFARPEEFLPAALFGLAAIGYYKKRAWETDTFEHLLLVGLVLNIVAEAAIMPFSANLYDFEFDFAHLLKIAAYTSVLAGLFVNMYTTYVNAENSIAETQYAHLETQRWALQTATMHNLILQASESDNLQATLQSCVDMVCEVEGWPIGHCYVIDEEDSNWLTSSGIWNIEGGGFPELRDITARTRFKRGVGLPGQVLESGKVVWIVDVQKDELFLRSKTSVDIGVKGAFAAPVIVANETIAVLEYFTVDAVEPDEQLMKFVELLGEQVGQVIERQRAVAKIAEAEKYLQTVTNQIVDALLVIDEDGMIRSTNPGTTRIFGYSPDEIVGQNIKVIIPEPVRSKDDRHIQTYMTFGDPKFIESGGELRGLRKDGSEFPMRIAVSEGQVNNERIFIGVAQDITESKKAEEQLQRHSLELAEARDHAEAANTTKSAFLASMSHEIRTPMNGVIGFTGLLLESDLSAEQREFAKTIEQSGNSLLNLINDILDFSKIEAGKLELEVVDFDLDGLVDSVMDLMSFQAEEKGLKFLSLIEPNVRVAVKGDPGRMRQVLVNLVGNAIKFTSEGEVVIRVENDPDSSDKPAVRVTVTDTGIGIADDAVGKLFQCFSQVDTSTTRQFGGTGLGLAISRQLVELMGGKIGVDSFVSFGSTFWFSVPLEQSSVGGEIPSRGPSKALMGKRVLVVDAHRTTRDVLKQHLTSWGCEVSVAEGAPEALGILKRSVDRSAPIDVAILDMAMAETPNVMTFATTVRDDQRLGDPLLIVSSSIGDHSQARTLLGSGFADCLVRPIKPSVLLESLITVLSSDGADLDQRLVRELTDQPDVTSQPGVRILVAEDNAVNQKVALRLLEKLGYRADCVANGQEAVEAVRTIPYDLVFMDVMMPEMDGFEATSHIRKLEGKASPVIVAMTANAMPGDRDKCLNAGMDDYVPKPVQKKDFAGVIQTYFAA
jgi:PAS domain S-box-containing protein